MNELWLPSTFQLLGRTVRVVRTPSEDFAEGEYGSWEPDCDEIAINDSIVSDDFQFHTFLHEFLHVAFDALGHEAAAEEATIDALAGLLHQMMKTAQP